MTADVQFLKATNEEWRRRNAALAALLLRIRAWDMMDSASDGAYWRSEIDKLLEEGHCAEQFKSWGSWVPVSERPLPKDDGTYLVTDGKHVAPMVRALIENNVGTPWDWDFGAKITHWMPLPETPHKPRTET